MSRLASAIRGETGRATSSNWGVKLTLAYKDQMSPRVALISLLVPSAMVNVKMNISDDVVVLDLSTAVAVFRPAAENKGY